MDTLGADILRCGWLDRLRNEMRVSDEILKRVSDTYRRIRNTARFLLGNLDGFDPVKHLVPVERSCCWTSGRSAGVHVQQAVIAAYDLRFPGISGGAELLHQRTRRVVPGHHQGPALHHADRQSAAAQCAERDVPHRRALVRWLAPVLSFTAEEVWSFMPGARNESVSLRSGHQFPAGAERGSEVDGPSRLRSRRMRRESSSVSERPVRSARRSGRRWPIDVPAEQAQKFSALRDELRFLLITTVRRA